MRLSVCVQVAFATTALAFGSTAAHAASKQFCSGYAKTAQKQFMLMQKYKKCQVPVDGRWQPKQRPHYEWCLTVPAAKPNAETQIRTDHLVACGATVEMAEPGMNPVD